MNPNTFDQFDPYAAISPPEFERTILEKIKVHLAHQFSPALLEEMRFRRDNSPMAESIARHLAYRLEAIVYGREAWGQTVEHRTEKDKTTKEVGKSTSVLAAEFVPADWFNHVKQTLWAWIAARNLHQKYRRLDAWLCRRKSALKLREIATKTENTTLLDVTPITKHIEVKKHYHICPHLDIKSNGPHLQFLANAAEVR